MVYNINYNISALVIIIVVLFMYFSKKNVPLFQNKYFIFLTTLAFMSTIFDLAQVLMLNDRYEFSMFSLNLTGFMSYLFYNSVAFAFALYCIAITGKRIKNYNLGTVLFAIVPMIISTIIVISNPFTGSVFYFDQNREYFHGNLQMVLYTINFYYVLFGIAYCTLYKRLTNKQVRISLYSFGFIAYGAAVLQSNFPNLLIEHFAISICIILIYMTIQKPEELIDATTGGFNRMSFSKIVEMSLRNDEKFKVLTVCIDDAVLLNRAFGIENMNDMLRKVATFLEKSNKRKVYYLNGCRFAMILKNKSPEQIDLLVKKIEKRFNEKWGYAEIEITLSSHICLIRCPEDASDIDKVLEYVDYSYKLEDINNWMLKAENISLSDRERHLKVEQIIKTATEEDGFEVYFQPIYSTKDKGVVSAEALARLYHPELGCIAPDEFIPIAEKNGAIIKIGNIIFEKVCSFMSQEDLKSRGIRYIEINLSVIQCVQENLALNLLDIMKRYGIENSRINLEITETAAIHSPQMLVKNMKKLYEKGIHFSLDDFGTGYSNMNSLVDLPFDMIKIDKGIIQASSKNDKAKVILWSSIAMIKKMDMEIVAEGIETREQAIDMAGMGCDYLQGFYISQPLPGKKFIKFLDSPSLIKDI